MDNNITAEKNKILNDKRVIAEIERHLWLESEKAGYNIGFEKAREDWLINFSSAWMKYHMPEAAAATSPAGQKPDEAKAPKAARAAKPVRAAAPKRRRAKSYL